MPQRSAPRRVGGARADDRAGRGSLGTVGPSRRRAAAGHLGPIRLRGDRDLCPDAVACLERLRADGMFVGLAGNQSATMEAWARETLPADVVTSSDGLGVRKPDVAFFHRLVGLSGVPADEVAYVGDRADNDVRPALAAGLVAVHLRRGPWEQLQSTPGRGDCDRVAFRVTARPRDPGPLSPLYASACRASRSSATRASPSSARVSRSSRASTCSATGSKRRAFPVRWMTVARPSPGSA